MAHVSEDCWFKRFFSFHSLQFVPFISPNFLLFSSRLKLFLFSLLCFHFIAYDTTHYSHTFKMSFLISNLYTFNSILSFLTKYVFFYLTIVLVRMNWEQQSSVPKRMWEKWKIKYFTGENIWNIFFFCCYCCMWWMYECYFIFTDDQHKFFSHTLFEHVLLSLLLYKYILYFKIYYNNRLPQSYLNDCWMYITWI